MAASKIKSPVLIVAFLSAKSTFTLAPSGITSATAERKAFSDTE